MKYIALALAYASTVWAAQTTLYTELPEDCPTPDAFAVAPDGTLTLSCPNYAPGGYSGALLSISKDRKIRRLPDYTIPGFSGKIRPMGLAYGPDGTLFVNSNGRVLALSFEEQTVTTEIIAHGISGPNGLRCHNGALYVTVPQMAGIKKDRNVGGVYRFQISERDVKVSNSTADKHLIFTSETKNSEKQFGLDGLAFDQKGHLYVGDFGDGTVFRLTLDRSGKVVDSAHYADLNTTGIDGMIFDKRGHLIVCGFSKNALYSVAPNGTVTTVVQYPDNDGSNGELDQPVDLVFFDGKLVISNFDLMSEPTMVNRSHGKPYTLSFLEVDWIP
ncbi:SMP-30/gluconolactonase/LRE family protein [Pontiella agarivorans]|uniref:SMP-30/gluconolactonase/LRE family protein n=1 Tax=Pontiella agarivorans TaxID=3038953 RepID=A0ABU5MYU6_9BACT|nr:SMP-30/gluconolactonase/LRE family protein [Pontiella agarivorans]MDZ8119353.1 SMP-30/gluconolactonase/LRE family protein [Pontiella agarivorans]